MASNDDKKMIPFYFSESIYRAVKVYAAETDQSMQQVLEPVTRVVEQEILKLVSQINDMRAKAEIERQKQEEDAELARQFPMKVPGIPAPDPLEPIAQ